MQSTERTKPFVKISEHRKDEAFGEGCWLLNTKRAKPQVGETQDSAGRSQAVACEKVVDVVVGAVIKGEVGVVNDVVDRGKCVSWAGVVGVEVWGG